MKPLPNTNLLRYGSAVVGVALATLARLALDPVLGDLFPFATLFFAVLIVSGHGGRGPALLATALGAVASARFLLPPRDGFALRGVEQQAGMALYLAVGLGIALLGGAMREALRRAERGALEARRALQVEHELRELLAITYRSIGDAVIATDGVGRVRLMNPVAEELTGWPQAEAEGRPLDEVLSILGEQTRQPVESPVDWVLREGGVIGLAEHCVVVARGGQETAIEDSAAPIKDATGAVVGVVMVFQDATERRRHEAALRASEERHREILESITDSFFALDRDWRFTYINRQAEAFMGRERGGLLGQVIWEEFASIAGTEIERSLRRAMAGDVAVPFEAFYGPHDRWFEARAYPSARGISVYFRDVTPRKRAEEEHERVVAESEKQRRTYETALSNTPDFNYILDLEGRFTYVNAALLGAWGKRLEEAVGRDFLDLGYAPDLASRLQGQVRQVIRERRPVRDETPFTGHPDERQYESIFMPVAGAGGAVEAVAGSTRDITERKRAEEAIRERERFTQRILDASPGIVYVFDLEDRRTVFVNGLAAGKVGMAPEEAGAGARYLADRVHPDDVPALEEHLGRVAALADGEVLATEYRVRHDDGRWLWFASRDTVFLRAPDGRPRQVLGVATDITDRKEAEGRLRDSEARFRTLAESIPQLAWVARPDGHIVWYNKRWHEYTGTTPEEMEGWGWQKVHDPAVLPGVLERWKGSIASGEPFDMVFPLRGADGRFRPFLTRVMPVRDEGGRIAHWFGTNTDISDRLRIEEELRAARDDADAANRAKTQFLAVLSHELRTPLNPILLATSAMLERPAGPEEVRPTLEMIRQNVNLQARLIDDLLDVMRIVRGKMALHSEAADCHRLIDQAVQICRSEFLGGELRLEVDLAATRHHVNADVARLQQVFWNLIKNAVKFTPRGGRIAIRTRNEPAADEPEGRIVVEVSDTGIGIDPAILPTIWDPFQQGESTITRQYGGLGLGLAICKGVVEAHGGSLGAESAGRGHGSTFRVVLQALPGLAATGNGDPTPEAPRAASGSQSSLRILVVEDEPTTLRIMARLLRGLGHRVATAETIASAFGAIEADDFDLIVSDIGLPDGTGLDLMRRIVALRGPIPAIALTGYGMEDDILRSREAGFSTHMTKPIDFTEFEALIRQVAP